MLASQYFLPLLKEKPSDTQIVSHALMIRSGMIRQHTSGIYSWLPLGIKVLHNIENIIRNKMNEAGFIEMLMPLIQNSELWKKSGRYNNYGKEMLTFQDRHDQELLFAPTSEEVITDIISNTIKSYKDLPKLLYQIHWKFRDEIRPRFGVIRGREFLMKDAYSFDIDNHSSMNTYDKMFEVYIKIFNSLQLLALPLIADNGLIGGAVSHEFHILAETGESLLYYDKKFNKLSKEIDNNIPLMKSMYAVTSDKYDPLKCPLSKNELLINRGIEVGHIFNFGDKYSSMMSAKINNKAGLQTTIKMGSYGIGISRLVAAIIEVHHDSKGIIWPIEVAPFKVVVINLTIQNEKCKNISNKIYNSLIIAGIDVLYDDKTDTPGSKLIANDLIGIPWQVIISNRQVANNRVELKNRASGKLEYMEADILVKELINRLDV